MKEVFCVVLAISLILGLMALPSIIFLVLLSSTYTRWICHLYLMWLAHDLRFYYKNYNSFLDFVQSWSLWKYFTSYFHGKLVMKCRLDPNRNYIIANHPHGLYCINIIANILANYNFKLNFPFVKLRVATLPINFFLPIWREFCLGIGSISCDRNTVFSILNGPKNGSAVMITVGGAKEFTLMKNGIRC